MRSRLRVFSESFVSSLGLAEGGACGTLMLQSSFCGLLVVGRPSTMPRTSCTVSVLLTSHVGLISGKAII